MVEHVYEADQQIVNSAAITRGVRTTPYNVLLQLNHNSGKYLRTQDTDRGYLESLWLNSKSLKVTVPNKIISFSVVDNSRLIAIGTDTAINNPKVKPKSLYFVNIVRFRCHCYF
jgi:hypothetical protein